MSGIQIYGLIGKKLGHSFSKGYFTKKFEQLRHIATYQNYELSEIQDILKVFELEGLRGLNVTIPYKETVIPYLDELSEEAKTIGAVNTILLKDGKKIGHNTDAFGFKQMIKPFFKSHHERALILGTGGASKAVDFVLTDLGCNVNYLSRNPEGQNQFGYEDCNELMLNAHKIIVNTTPLGMYPNVNEMPDIPTEYLTTDHLVIDLIYNPERTKLLEQASNNGAVVLNGQTMLEQQAEKAWSIWNG